jgi:hypothetical protein
MRTSSWLLFFALLCIGLEKANSQDVDVIVEGYLLSQVDKKSLSPKDVEFVVTNNHVSGISKVHHLYFSQTLFGIQIDRYELFSTC